MSFRRFVYLVTDDLIRRNYLLRRIDMSRFFLPECKRDGLLTNPPPLEEAELPPAVVKFDPPTSVVGNEDMEFMLFPGGDSGRRNKVVATDPTSRVVLYDPESISIRSIPSFTSPKFAPISLAVGNSHYVLDRSFSRNNCDECFHRFFHDDDWYCQSLPPPPYVHANGAMFEDGMSHVDSYAVVGGSNIWISESTLGTHCFDTVNFVWSKVGNWALPFSGHVQYVPEHKLWFGLPSADNSDEDDGNIYTSDLTVTPPTIRKVWENLTRPEWTSRSSYLVHLGHSKFCHARFFQTRRPVDLDYLSYVVLTGMEAEVCGNAGGEIRVVKHRSELYKLVDKLMHWVL